MLKIVEVAHSIAPNGAKTPVEGWNAMSGETTAWKATTTRRMPARDCILENVTEEQDRNQKKVRVSKTGCVLMCSVEFVSFFVSDLSESHATWWSGSWLVTTDCEGSFVEFFSRCSRDIYPRSWNNHIRGLHQSFPQPTNSLSLYYFVARRWWSQKGESFVSTTFSFLVPKFPKLELTAGRKPAPKIIFLHSIWLSWARWTQFLIGSNSQGPGTKKVCVCNSTPLNARQPEKAFERRVSWRSIRLWMSTFTEPTGDRSASHVTL